jgi:hypothetical protein
MGIADWSKYLLLYQVLVNLALQQSEMPHKMMDALLLQMPYPQPDLFPPWQNTYLYALPNCPIFKEPLHLPL